MADELDKSIDSSVDALAGELGLAKDEAGVDSSSTTAAAEAGTQQPAGGAPPVVEEVVAPKSWSKEAQAVFNTLPEIARKEIMKREADALNGITKYKTDAEWAGKLRGAFQPYAATINSLGVDEMTAVQQLFAADHILRYGTPTQKQQLMKSMIQNFGIDYKALGAEEPYVDPAMKPVLDKVSSLESAFTSLQQEHFTALREEAEKKVAKFAADKEAHPYFEELGDDITKLINVGFSLEDAYERAVWANPVTRAKEQAKATAEAEERVRKELVEAAKGAKKSTAANVKAAPKEKEAAAPVGSMDDTLAETLSEIHSRVH